jgi:hypothetical protein
MTGLSTLIIVVYLAAGPYATIGQIHGVTVTTPKLVISFASECLFARGRPKGKHIRGCPAALAGDFPSIPHDSLSDHGHVQRTKLNDSLDCSVEVRKSECSFLKCFWFSSFALQSDCTLAGQRAGYNPSSARLMSLTPIERSYPGVPPL